MKLYTYEEIEKVLSAKSYLTANHDSNIVNIYAIRSDNNFNNKFDDLLIWVVNGELKYARCTTDPGLYYVKNPINYKGTGVIKEGQYKDAYKLGLHKGIYLALVQNKSVTLWRDNNLDETIDMVDEDTGFFGINIHRANPNAESQEVNKWSAACIVISNPYKFSELMKDCKMQVTDANKCYFTLTVLHENDFERGC